MDIHFEKFTAYKYMLIVSFGIKALCPQLAINLFH